MRKLLVLSAIFMQACTGQRATGLERNLFPSVNGDTWWIFNALPGNGGMHHQFLFTADHSFTQLFWSAANDSVVNSGYLTGQSFSWDGKLKFPLVLTSAESNAQPVRLWMNKNEFVSTGVAELALQHTASLAQQLQPLLSDSAVVACLPFPCKVKGLQDSLYFSLACFREATFLLEVAKSGPVIWLTLVVPGRAPMVALLTGTGSNEFQVHQVGEHAFKAASLPNEKWTSAVTGKTWPLGLQISDEQSGINWRVLPLQQNQEIAARQASIWMGAVKVADANGQSIGTGDMIIFTR